MTLDDLGFDEPWLVVDVLANARGLAKLPQTSVQYCEPARPDHLCDRHRRAPALGIQPQSRRGSPTHGAAGGGLALLSRWIGPDDGTLWRSASYRFHALVARDWRKERIFIAGDAAHQQPPFLGQGLCQGIRDAANLAWKLTAVVRGQAQDALLDSYGPERRGHVNALTGIIKSIGRLIGERDPALAGARDERLIAEAGGDVRPMPRQDLMPVLAEGFLGDDPSPAAAPCFRSHGSGRRMAAGPAWMIMSARLPPVQSRAVDPSTKETCARWAVSSSRSARVLATLWNAMRFSTTGSTGMASPMPSSDRITTCSAQPATKPGLLPSSARRGGQ